MSRWQKARPDLMRLKQRQCPWLVLCAVSAFSLAQPVQAASFDCAKAQTAVERMICGDAELSRLDEVLARVYSDALQSESAFGAIQQAQTQWLKERNRCSNAACLQRAYEARLSALQPAAESVGSPSPVPGGGAAPVASSPPQSQGEVCLQPTVDWRNYGWTLMSGKHKPECQEMLAYLQSRPKDLAPPLCPEERLPPGANWSRPQSRELSAEEKEALLQAMPKDIPWIRKNYEGAIRRTRVLRVITGGISGDGIPDHLLAYDGANNYRKSCERAKRCAVVSEAYGGQPLMSFGWAHGSDYYSVLPMTIDGNQIDWMHKTVGLNPTLMNGELIFYADRPFWLSVVRWNQAEHDKPTRNLRIDDPYNAMFTLKRIWVGNSRTRQGEGLAFKDVTAIAIQADPESKNVCRFGYFRNEKLHQNVSK